MKFAFVAAAAAAAAAVMLTSSLATHADETPRYTRYVAQGGDWGAPITSAMARHVLANKQRRFSRTAVLGKHGTQPSFLSRTEDQRNFPASGGDGVS